MTSPALLRMPRSPKGTILGLDPGLTRTGYAFISFSAGTPTLLNFGCINTEKVRGYTQRLLALEKELSSLLTRFQPSRVGIEKLFFSKNVSTAMSVGQARGVLLLTLAHHHLEAEEVTPQQVKIAVTGYGRAEKQQVQRMIQILFHLKTIPKPDDAADAIAVALATGQTSSLR